MKTRGVPVLVVLVMAVQARANLIDGLVSYWPLDGSGNAKIGNVNPTPAVPDAISYDDENAIAGQALQVHELPFLESGLRADGTSFGLTNEVTISQWYRVDAVGSTGEKAGVWRGWGLGFYNPDNSTNFGWQMTWMNFLGVTNSINTGHDQPPANHFQKFGEWWHLVQRIDDGGHDGYMADPDWGCQPCRSPQGGSGV